MRFEAVIFAFSVLVTPLAGFSGRPPATDGPWVMVIPPWADRAAIVERAGAQLVGPAEAPFGQLVAGPDRGASERLKAAGAWLVLDADFLEGYCGPRSEL